MLIFDRLPYYLLQHLAVSDRSVLRVVGNLLIIAFVKAPRDRAVLFVLFGWASTFDAELNVALALAANDVETAATVLDLRVALRTPGVLFALSQELVSEHVVLADHCRLLVLHTVHVQVAVWPFQAVETVFLATVIALHVDEDVGTVCVRAVQPMLAVGRWARLDRFHAVEMHERQRLQIGLGARPPDHFLDVLWVQLDLTLLVHAAEREPPVIDIDRQIMIEALEMA